MTDPSKTKFYFEDSVFKPENLLREARRQKNIQECNVPGICVLDPDGDIVRYLKRTGAQRNPCWACYHSELYDGAYKGLNFGIIGCAVGAPYAVLLAEQLFVSGCELLISITSAGKINDSVISDYLLIGDALRDEGTSYHYLPAGEPCALNDGIRDRLSWILEDTSLSVELGKSWTTDAPYRETRSSISQARRSGADCVEMEASALYAFSKSMNRAVVCFAHLTNSMAQQNGDFEKGAENGSLTSLELIFQTARCLTQDAMLKR